MEKTTACRGFPLEWKNLPIAAPLRQDDVGSTQTMSNNPEPSPESPPSNVARRGSLAHRRPLGIVIISIAYVVSPLLNILQVAWWSDVTVARIWAESARIFGVPGLVLLFAAPIVGVGIFLARRWGYALFLLHAAGVIAFNTVLLLTDRAASKGSILTLDVLLFLGVAYMLRKDARAPYLARDPRGWRRGARAAAVLPVTIRRGDVTVDGRTINRSFNGFVCRITDTVVPLSVGDDVVVSFPTESNSAPRTARIVRVDGAIVAVTFIRET